MLNVHANDHPTVCSWKVYADMKSKKVVCSMYQYATSNTSWHASYDLHVGSQHGLKPQQHLHLPWTLPLEHYPRSVITARF